MPPSQGDHLDIPRSIRFRMAIRAREATLKRIKTPRLYSLACTHIYPRDRPGSRVRTGRNHSKPFETIRKHSNALEYRAEADNRGASPSSHRPRIGDGDRRCHAGIARGEEEEGSTTTIVLTRRSTIVASASSSPRRSR